MLTSSLRVLAPCAVPGPAPPWRNQSTTHDARTLSERLSNTYYMHIENLRLYVLRMRARFDPSPCGWGQKFETASCWRRVEGEGETTQYFSRELQFKIETEVQT